MVWQNGADTVFGGKSKGGADSMMTSQWPALKYIRNIRMVMILRIVCQTAVWLLPRVELCNLSGA